MRKPMPVVSDLGREEEIKEIALASTLTLY